EGLLSLSRTSRAELRIASVNLEKLVGEVRDKLILASGGRAIEWQIGALPEVEADPALLRVVVENLLSNAVKFSRKRDPARIEVGAQTDSKEQVIFVRDNGAGFDGKYASRLFNVFQRLHSQQEFEGAGMGLAIVQGIILRHGGRVWADGKEGEGASFYFALPKKSGAEVPRRE